MIISHSKQFAFFRNPKTGSTTASFFLRISADFPEGDHLTAMPGFGFGEQGGDEFIHCTPQKAIDKGYITLQQLRDYKTYAYVRDPHERLISGLIYTNGRHFSPDLLGQLMDRKSEVDLRKRYSILLALQKDWFFVDGEQVVTPLKMGPQFVPNLRRMIDDVGGVQVPNIPPLNSKGHIRKAYPDSEWLTPRFNALVQELFAEDIAWYQGL